MLIVLDLDLAATVIEQSTANRGRSAHALTHHPVHALVHHRLASKVRGVDEARTAIHTPAIHTSPLKELLSRIQHPLRHRQRTVKQGRTRLNRQARPLQPVPGSDTVGAEGVSRLVLVVVQDRLPGGVIVLRQAPVVGTSLLVDGKIDDLDGTVEPLDVTTDVSGG
ncbi:MAG: hypothetical protein Q605_AUC00754G0003 [Actinomyces urogenitalis DORA_12]|uniref:Uncharacterized protein n=1 Tax=Actinomyces urogenitalis DORA_12 TaxID=1403939 RepID=W1VGS0_9ACTO|nr:MAG: hypothetical protein Q605_AUC00754G0003 [Actinomyces urogenitalis DORA_12]